MLANWVCYIVRCSDGSLYTGVTNRLEERIKAHNEGRGAKYTKTRRPVTLVVHSYEMTRSQASKLEAFVKSVRSDKKIEILDSLCRGHETWENPWL